MLGDERLRARLSELSRSRRSARVAPGPGDPPAALAAEGPRAAGGTSGADASVALETGAASAARAPRRRAGRPASAAAVGVEAFLPGGEWRDAHGAVYVHERLRHEIETPRPHWGRLDSPPDDEPDLSALAAAGMERALFLDLETGGLGSSPVFLAGTMHWNGETFVLRQYFARHYGEEAPLVRALAEAAREFEFLVTFNGKSYDAPFLRGRAVVHGVRFALPPRHIDLLHLARRRWGDELSDCRLITLERHVCRRWRSGDVPSDEVPGLYHDYVRDGDPYRLIPVFHHNLLDVITMGEILQALCGARTGRGRAARAASGARARRRRDAAALPLIR